MIRHELFQDSILNKSRRTYNTARLQRVFLTTIYYCQVRQQGMRGMYLLLSELDLYF
jgi:hypothetical protein